MINGNSDDTKTPAVELSRSESLSTVERRAPLRIVHLLLWMVSCAIYLTISLYAQDVLQAAESGHLPVERVEAALSALVSGTVLTSLVILLRERFCGSTLAFRQPGHWLMLAIAPVILIDAPLKLLFFSLHDKPHLDSANKFLECLTYAVATIILIFAIKAVREKWWRLSFAVLAVGFAFESLGEFTVLIHLADFGYGGLTEFLYRVADLAKPIAGMLVAIVSVADLTTRNGRDWLHWTGVIAFLMPAVTMVLSDLAS